MSALIRQSHANNTDPLWASANGGENIVTDQLTINQGGNITMGSSINDRTPIIFNKALNGSTQATLSAEYVADDNQDLALTLQNEQGQYDILQIGDLFVFGLGQNYGAGDYLSFNGTGGSFGLSWGDLNTRTAYLDKLETGVGVLTSNIIGPVPVNCAVGGPYAINPIPTSPTAFDYFGLAPSYPTTSGNEYDVCAMGTFTLVSGTADANVPDIMAVSFSVGGTQTGLVTNYFNPATGNWNIRARLICTSTSASIRVGCQNTQKGTSTAVWSATCSLCDIVRVK